MIHLEHRQCFAQNTISDPPRTLPVNPENTAQTTGLMSRYTGSLFTVGTGVRLTLDNTANDNGAFTKQSSGTIYGDIDNIYTPDNTKNTATSGN